MMKIIILCTPTNNYSFAFNTASITTSLHGIVSYSSCGIGGSSSNSIDRIGIGNSINRQGIWILSAENNDGGGGGALGKKAYNDNALFNFHMSKQVVVRL